MRAEVRVREVGAVVKDFLGRQDTYPRWIPTVLSGVITAGLIALGSIGWSAVLELRDLAGAVENLGERIERVADRQRVDSDQLEGLARANGVLTEQVKGALRDNSRLRGSVDKLEDEVKRLRDKIHGSE